MTEKGFSPVCVDLSKAMVALCRQKGLIAYQMDMEKLVFDNDTFDGIWAYVSLVHMQKNKIGNVLKKISELLKKKELRFMISPFRVCLPPSKPLSPK